MGTIKSDIKLLMCLQQAIETIENSDEEMSDFEAMLMRDLKLICSQLRVYIQEREREAANSEPPKDNVVHFPIPEE